MKKRILFVNPTGFSYLEMIVSLFLIMNLFVLFHQIFYNMDIYHQIEASEHRIEYEVFLLRIERDLKEAKDLKVYPESIVYTYRNQIYTYKIFNSKVILTTSSGRTIYYLYHVSKISFILNERILYIKITDMNQEIYESKVIIP